MLTIKYNIVESEGPGENGRLEQITRKVLYDESSASIEKLGDEIRELQKQGYFVECTLKLKTPKD